jgi:hypothetical protein
MNRPGMGKLLAALRSGKLCRIVVWRLDRLGRTTKGLCQLFDELCERSVDLVSLKDGFSLESPAGRMPAYWQVLPSTRPRSEPSESQPVKLRHGATERRGAAVRRAGGGESPTIRSLRFTR